MISLKESLRDAVEEAQLKLGYRREAMRLYYPLSSLCALTGIKTDAAGMEAVLRRFAEEEQNLFGEIAVSRQGDRFCLTVPPEGAQRIHEQADAQGFLAQLLAAVSRPGAHLADALAVFSRFSDGVVVRAMRGEEFDTLVYFARGEPNAYRYCFKQEPCHLIYHRFTPEDYESFGFEDEEIAP